MPKQRNYSTEFEPGCSGISGRRDLHGLAKRHDVSRNVTRLWVARYEADGQLNDDTAAADLLQDYKARISAVERPAGKLALEVGEMAVRDILSAAWR
jgi:transposase-like protein